MLAAACAVLSCGEAGRSTTPSTTTTKPVVPIVPAKPAITLSTDSVVASATSGADTIAYAITVGAADTTSVRNLTIAIAGLGDGDTGTWLVAQLDGTTAPAKLTVRVDPRTAVVGLHTATISIGATNADSKSVRVRMSVRARPMLLVDSSSRMIAAALGDSVPSVSLGVRSSNDTITKLSLGTPACDRSAWMSARLSGDATPATVALSFDLKSLPAGTFSCRVDVRSTQALVDSASRTIVVSLTMRQAPRIAIDVPIVTLATTTGNDASAAQVHITNAGTGTLDGLALGAIDYGGGPTGWMSAAIDGTTAPASVTIAPSARLLSPGNYHANVPVTSTATGVTNSPTLIAVTLVVSPRPFRFAVSPTSASITYNLTTKQGNSVAISFSDSNGSGQKASFTHFTATTQSPGPCPAFTIAGPLGTTPALPQTDTFSVSPFNTVPGSCTFVYALVLDNGQTGSFTLTVSVTP